MVLWLRLLLSRRQLHRDVFSSVWTFVRFSSFDEVIDALYSKKFQIDWWSFRLSHKELCIASFTCRITWSDPYSSARFGHIVGSLLTESLGPPEELWRQATCKLEVSPLDHGSVLQRWHPCSGVATSLTSLRRCLRATTLGSSAGSWLL